MESSSDNSRELVDVISGWVEIAMFVLRDEHTLLPGLFLPAHLKLVYGIIAVKPFDKKILRRKAEVRRIQWIWFFQGSRRNSTKPRRLSK